MYKGTVVGGSRRERGQLRRSTRTTWRKSARTLAPFPLDAHQRPPAYRTRPSGAPERANTRPFPLDARQRPPAHRTRASGAPERANTRPLPLDAQQRPLAHRPRRNGAPRDRRSATANAPTRLLTTAHLIPDEQRLGECVERVGV